MAFKGQDKDGEMARRSRGNGPAAADDSPFGRMLVRMGGLATMDEADDSARFSGDDLTAILTAETEDEMWEADMRGPLNAKDLSGCEMEIYEFEVKFSRGGRDDIRTPFTHDGRQMYLLIHAARISKAGAKPRLNLPGVGEKFTFNTSARFIVAKLMRLLELGNFDNGQSVRCRIEGVDLGAGQSVEKLRPITATTVTGSVEPNEPPF